MAAARCDGAGDDVTGCWRAGMLAGWQAQVGRESGGADGCHGEALPGQRADVLPGGQDGAGQAGARPGLGGVAEDAVGDEGFGREPWRPGPAFLAVVRRGFLRGVSVGVELAVGGGGEGVRVRVDLDVDAEGGDPGGPADRAARGRGAGGIARLRTPSRSAAGRRRRRPRRRRRSR